MLRFSQVAVVVAALLAMTGGAGAETRPRLLATIGMIADPAARIAGECVVVEALIGPGLDPHLYQPRPSDIARLREADAIVALGLGLEGRLADVLVRTGATLLGDAVDPALLHDAGGAPDPHLWMDPARWAAILPPLAALMVGLAPDCAGRIDEGLRAETARLAALDGWAATSLATIPQERRVLLTAHDAFGYFAARYGLENLAVQGISTESEPSIAGIEALARLATERGIPAVFVESTLNPRAVQALIDAAAARGHRLEQGGELYSDALGAAGSGADTYPGMIIANVVTITRALGGEPADLPALLATP